jgi:hypothetical protein
VPSWGRPPGAKGSKQRRKWEREQALWAEQFRIEELDSDEDTDTQGVGLNFAKKRFVSDPLQFTGIDMSAKPRSRRSYAFDESEEESDSDEDGNESAAQVALRDKEEALVQSALARIRRAQEKGKLEVKLHEDEVKALERRRKRLQSAAASNSRKGSVSSGGGEKEKKRRAMVTIPIAQPDPGRRSNRHREDSPTNPPSRAALPLSGAPGLLIEGQDGNPTYAPIGYYPQPASARGSPARPRSSSSQHRSRQTPPPPFQYQAYPGTRHISEGTRPMSSGSNHHGPLPHEEGWTPSSRSSRRSSVSSNHYADPFEFQTSSGTPPPIPEQYASSRRHASGPHDVIYSSIRRSVPGSGAYPASSRSYVGASSNDPTQRRRRLGEEANSDLSETSSEDVSDDFGNGVRVEPERLERSVAVVPVPAKKPVGGSKKKKGKK